MKPSPSKFSRHLAVASNLVLYVTRPRNKRRANTYAAHFRADRQERLRSNHTRRARERPLILPIRYLDCAPAASVTRPSPVETLLTPPPYTEAPHQLSSDMRASSPT